MLPLSREPARWQVWVYRVLPIPNLHGFPDLRRFHFLIHKYLVLVCLFIVVIPRLAPAWIIGLHRFLEVSVEIIVALAVVACGLNINGARGKARMNNAIFATTCLSSVSF